MRRSRPRHHRAGGLGLVVVGLLLFALGSCSESQPLRPAADDGVGAALPPPEAVPGGPERGYLTVFADADETEGDLPLLVTVEVEVLDGTGVPPFRFVWDFGDATAHADGRRVQHIYEVPGDFRASVIVHDARGEIDQDYVDISVRASLAPDALTAEELMRRFPLSEVAPELAGAGAGEGGPDQ